MKRLLLLISLVTLILAIPLTASANGCPSPADASAQEVCKCRLDDAAWDGLYKNLGNCVAIVNACNQADVTAVCECKWAQAADSYKGAPFADCFKNLGDCVSFLLAEGYTGGPLPICTE